MTDPSCWKVVITDDDPQTLQIVQRLLVSYGAEVSIASDGRECLRLLRENLPTVLLLDIEMPEMSGWDVIHTIRHSNGMRDLLVVAITARAEWGLRQRIRAAGFNALFEKPFSTLTLVDDLNALIDNRDRLYLKSILLIDDDPHVANVFREVADHQHLELTIATDAQIAYDYLSQFNPDVIVSDIFLPGTDGIQALRYIRAHMLAENCPIVATSAYYTSDTEHEMKEWGFSGFLPKPFDLPKLIPFLEQVIQDQFDNRSAQDALQD